MAISGEQIKVTDLDFQTIKGNLIEFFKNSDNDFSDWDFEGSNLNTIVDLLAYNTHYNAMLAHMTVNESFIDSAQLRSSVVSAAKLLGYVPRSFSASQAVLEGKFLANQASPDTTILERGTAFSTTVDNKDYQYVVLDNTIELVKDGDYYVTTPDNLIVANEGRIVKTTFVANGSDDSQRYQIDDENIDISTLKVRVFPTVSKTQGSSILYQRYGRGLNVNQDSSIYFINENSFERYELTFGNGVYGRKLNSGNVIELEYLVTTGSEPNGSNTPFKMNTINSDIASVEYVKLSSGNRVSGGSEKETINRLKQNATNSFITQNRAVTSDDYKNLIGSNFQYAQSISVWGGEDNNPPIYGKTFICVKPYSSYQSAYLTPADKSSVLDFVKGKKVLSIIPEIVDPEYINIVLDVLFKYDSNLLSRSVGELQNEIRNEIITSYNENILNTFDTVFRHSQFSRSVDEYDRAILNSLVRVFVKQSFVIPGAGFIGDKLVNFGVPLTTDDDKAIIEISSDVAWTENETKVFLSTESTDLPNIRNVYTYTLKDGTTRTRLRDVGEMNLEEGTMTLNNTVYADADTTINVTVIPKSNDIVGKRNVLLSIDNNTSIVRGSVDEIVSGGSSRAVEYNAFDRDRS